MKVTVNWLREFVEIESTAQELAAALTMGGLEVESLTCLSDPESGREDWLVEIGVTPNRGDCLSVAGIAREVAALTGATLKKTSHNPPAKNGREDKRVAVAIEDPQLCLRYSAGVIDDVTIAPSPDWLRYRIEACGIRAINNIVDITNYVMLETGQPLHAFDLDRLQEKNIVVRRARAIGKFTTLDGVERELASEDLLICDGAEPVALAGVMGGQRSEVTPSTRTLLLESANFSPVSIRRTAKRLGLHSEASHRFERGVDPEGTIAALSRAADLIEEIAGGRPQAAAIDRYPGKTKPPTIVLREARIEALLGVKVDRGEAARLLGALGLKTRDHPRRRSLTVAPPANRSDITREADLIEEVARLYGYDRIPTTLPPLRSGGKIDLRLKWERKLRYLLAGEGLSEVINLPFMPADLNRDFAGVWEEGGSAAVSLINPLAKDNAEMRRSLLPGLIDNLRSNLAHQARSFHGYHLGKVFGLHQEGATAELECLAGLMYGSRGWHGLRFGDERSVDFLQCKGVVEAVLELFNLRERVSWAPSAFGALHPGKSADLSCGEALLGYVGQVHPDLADRLELPPVFVFELDLEKLLSYAPRRMSVSPLPRFPAVERDVALVVDRDFASQEVIRWIESLGESLIERVEVFDQYLGAPVPEGKKSLAYRISYRAEDRTLTDSEINELHQRLVDRLGDVFAAERRG